MLPGGPLVKQLSKLKMYYGDKHPHESKTHKKLILKILTKKIKFNKYGTKQPTGNKSE